MCLFFHVLRKKQTKQIPTLMSNDSIENHFKTYKWNIYKGFEVYQ